MGNRERIIEASLELFNERGTRSVTTNHIAAHLSISPGNLYYHFPNKEALVVDTRFNEIMMMAKDNDRFSFEVLMERELKKEEEE